MQNLPSTVDIDGKKWVLGVNNREPIYTCDEPDVPTDFEDMQPLEIEGLTFGPALDTSVSHSLHYRLVTRGSWGPARELHEARSRILVSNKAQNYLLKLLSETDQDDDEEAALLEALFLIERDRNYRRNREKQARKELLDQLKERTDINRGRPPEKSISEHEQAFFLDVGDRRADEECSGNPALQEKREAIIRHDREKRARGRRAFELLQEAGYGGGIAVFGKLDEERTPARPWKVGKRRR